MKTYTFAEYKQMQEFSNFNREINTLDKLVGNLSKNKKEYARTVFLLAVFMPKIAFAESLGLSEPFDQLLDLGLELAQYGCMIKGFINMTTEMLEGANLKEAISQGLGYFVFYLVLKFYPIIFSVLK